MGTDLWADENRDSGPDQPIMPMPISLLDYGTQDNPATRKFQVAGVLQKVKSEAWDSWDLQLHTPDPSFRPPLIELIVTAELIVKDFSTKATVLIDTGCRVDILFRKNLAPEES